MFKSINLLILNSITFMVLNAETTVAIHFSIILLVLCSITLLIQILPQEREKAGITGQNRGYTLNIKGRGMGSKKKTKVSPWWYGVVSPY